MPKNIELPDWSGCADKKEAGHELDPLERFVYDQEPAGDQARVFRQGLKALIGFVTNGN